MMWELIKSDFRKAALPYGVVLGALAAYVLFWPKPLNEMDLAAGVLGVAEGIVLAWCLFRDGGGTEAFIFSRPFTRGRLFTHRLALGIALQILTIAVLFLLLATGLRSYIQHFQLPYYPMIKWYELNILKPVAICGLFAFELQMFFMLRGRILHNGAAGRIKIFVGLAVTFFVLAGFAVGIIAQEGIQFAGVVKFALIGYLAVAVVATACVSLHCLKNMEIAG